LKSHLYTALFLSLENGENVDSGIDFTLILGYNLTVLFKVKK